MARKHLLATGDSLNKVDEPEVSNGLRRHTKQSGIRRGPGNGGRGVMLDLKKRYASF